MDASALADWSVEVHADLLARLSDGPAGLHNPGPALGGHSLRTDADLLTRDLVCVLRDFRAGLRALLVPEREAASVDLFEVSTQLAEEVTKPLVLPLQ
ncbi:hypothetical protein SCALM49S_01672 [Streptomyces californicus]